MVSLLKSCLISATVITGLFSINTVNAETSEDVQIILKRLNQLESELTSLKKQLKEKIEAASNTTNLENKNNFYVTAGVGFLGDTFFTDADYQLYKDYRSFLDNPLDGSWSGELGLGYKFTKNLRGEISYSTSILQDNTTYATVNNVGATGLGLGQIDNHSIFVSTYYDFLNDTKFTPYLGIGFGPSLIDTDNVFGNSNKNIDVTLGYQGKFGVSYEAFDSTDLFLEGAYQATKSFKLHAYQIDPLEMFSTRFGIRYNF